MGMNHVATIAPALAVILLAAGIGGVVHFLLFRSLRKASGRKGGGLERAVLHRCAAPSRFILPIFAISIAIPATMATFPGGEAIARIASILLILGIAWSLIALTGVLLDLVVERYRIDVSDNLHARKIHTQVDLIRKIVIVVVVVTSGAVVLMSFEAFRVVGTGLLASAGLAGLILGFAAQKTLGNLVAGFQIAVTQPIRIDDVVVVEGEWGRVEEITLTYVVVRIWDLRRLVLPISYFIEKPFQNWTRTSADVLGTVFLHVDYTVPVEDIRGELRKLLEKDERWDGKVCVLHVTDAGARTVEIRALMSAGDSGTAWELRCAVRERLLEYLRREHPDGLPRLRAEVNGSGGAKGDGYPSSGGG